MQKITFKHWSIAAVTVFCFAITGSLVNAAPDVRAGEMRQNPSERNEAAKTKSADAKLKSCQKNQVKTIAAMTRIADRGSKQLEVFTKIADRTKTFYKEKGKLLPNYDLLVAEVDRTKSVAEATLEAIRTSSTTFECHADGSQNLVVNFKDELKAEIAALKEYKTAVKNLIVGVKSVQGKTSSAENNTNRGEVQ